jgi:hypothetical protein
MVHVQLLQGALNSIAGLCMLMFGPLMIVTGHFETGAAEQLPAPEQ